MCVLALCMVAVSVLGACSAWTAPDSPANATVGFMTDLQVGTDDEIRGRVCSEARDEGRDRPFGYEALEDRGSYHGTGVVREDGDSAVVFGDLTVEGGFDYETWAFELLDEGSWKVCRVRPATSEELRLVSAERNSPPPTYRRTLCERNPENEVCPISFLIAVPDGCDVPPPFEAFGQRWEYSEGASLGAGQHDGQLYRTADEVTFTTPTGETTRFQVLDESSTGGVAECR
jgi:hypothetical protein